MFLAENGIYYFDEEMKNELSIDIFNEIKNKLNEKYENSCVQYINKKQFTFKAYFGYFYILDDKQNSTELSYFPIDIIFNIKGKKQSRTIFSLSQYKKTLEFFGFVYPWAKSLLLSKNNLETLIYSPFYRNNSIEIEDLDIFNIDISEKPNKNEIHKLKDLSDYITYYLKNEINLEKYPEKKYLNKKDFILNKESEFEYYMKKERTNISCSFECMIKKDKEYFFTGNSSIGKTFTLLGLTNWKSNNIRRAYYNLKALYKSEEYFKIIVYESRNLFENKKQWMNAFHKIEEQEIKTPLGMILRIIEDVSLLGKKEFKYIFIIDQIKFGDINKDKRYKIMNKIRKFIKETNNFFLIGCFALNYKGTKQILFYNWFRKNVLENELNIPKVDLKEIDLLNCNESDNKYLKLVGNFPSYRSLKDKLNIKIINILIKIIKEKIKKFYDYEESLILKNLENIPVNKIFENEEDFENLLNNIPFKYFKIDIQKRMIDYSYLLVKIAISEMLHSIKLKKYSCNSFIEYDWHNERRVIDLVKTSHVLGKYYIDNSYEIPSIYFKHEIKDEYFDQTENSFFYFSYFKVRRYNCAIYFGNQQSLLLIQIATFRTKSQLKKYNKDNLLKDIDSMQKFFFVNKLNVKKYYLIFIIALNNLEYKKNVEKAFNESDLKYCVYDLSNDEFIDNSFTPYEITTYKNQNLININEESKIIKFYLESNSFVYEESKNGLKCYAEIGMSLDDFLDQFIDNYLAEKLREEFRFEESYHLKFVRKCRPKHPYLDLDLDDNLKLLFFNYSEDIVYIGRGICKNHRCNFSFEAYELTLGIVNREKKERFSEEMNGFIFEGNFVN